LRIRRPEDVAFSGAAQVFTDGFSIPSRGSESEFCAGPALKPGCISASVLRRFWREHGTGDVEENFGSHDLSRPEVAALFGLARTPLERRALHKVLGTILTDRLLRSKHAR
jgi:hypothetical protein